MSFIEKEKLIKADIASIENRVRHAFNQGYDLGFKDGKKRAKSKEQEPKSEWQKDHEILKAYSDGANDVLDKISGEIIEKYWDCDICKWKRDNKPHYNVIGDIGDILQIIDKYKGESER